ncbi:hypothetical protein BgiMline_012529, partial [Biomphalaria glabrata]
NNFTKRQLVSKIYFPFGNREKQTYKMSCLFVMVGLFTLASADIFSCTKPTPVTPAPPMPSIFQTDSYQATVEINILDKNYSMVTQEYLDYQNNIGAIIAFTNGVKTQVIYSYRSGEIFEINFDGLSTCTVKNMSTSPYVSYLGPMFNNINGDIRHIFGSSAALNFASNSSYVFNGTGTVRGLPVNIWTTCLTYPNTKAPIQVTFYFSQAGWNTSWSQQQMPLRVEIKGVTQTSTFGSLTTQATPRYFHHMYDFINYLPTVDPTSSVFKPPRRVACLNRINTHPLPKIQTTFKYKAEIVNPSTAQVTHYQVWYNAQAKLVREDTRSKTPDPKVGVTTTVTEIHDFSTDVRYIIDPQGGCSAFPMDSKQSDVNYTDNQSAITITMKDPNSFFQFNENYKYVGQRLARGITCDVFSTVIPNFNAGGNIVNATFEYYFLPQDWNDISLVGLEPDDLGYPVQLVISADIVDYIRIYNFFDFGEYFVQADAFDATKCTQPDAKMKIQITFPGSYNPAAMDQWKQQLYFQLAETMQINPLRIGSLSIEADAYSIYASAWILGTAYYAQFQQIDQPSKEHVDDKVIYMVNSPLDCAGLCLENIDFQCNSYEYCIYDRFACRLLENHMPTVNNTVLANATDCVLNTRPIVGPAVKETPVAVAYLNLVEAVQAKQVFVSLPDANGNTNMYTAINVDVITGQPVPGKTLPNLPNQFSYRIETVKPQQGRVSETFVWYDGNLDIVRYDSRDPYGDNQYMMTYIQDFTRGLSYQINQVTGSCKINALGPGAFDVVNSKPSPDGNLVVSLKSPQSLFYLSDSYRFVGQKTVRGILCDIFESSRGDFSVPALQTSQSSIFKYYFQTSEWDYVSPDGTDITHSKPVMLEVEDTTTGFYFAVNFYDFNDQGHSVNYFDTSACYDNDQKNDFLVIFKGQPYHPYLDQAYNSFINSAAQLMASWTQLSPMQFQQLRLTYDDNNDVYLFVTSLGNVPPIDLFTPTMQVGLNSSANYIQVDDEEDCAAACVATNSFICNSFDYCGGSCLLGQKHSESEGDPTATPENNPCTHYTRTEDGSLATLDVAMIYSKLTDYVYDNLFQITITLPDNTNKTYIATDIRDDLEIPNDPSDTSGSLLRNYVVTPNSKFLDSVINTTYEMVSITDCALSCSQENTFTCESFDYSFTTGLCRLTSLHPDEIIPPMPAIINSSIYTNVYSSNSHYLH